MPSQNRQPAPLSCTLATFRGETSVTHCQPCSFSHLGNRVCEACSYTAGQILDSLQVSATITKETKENERPPLKVVAFPSVSVSTALLTSASVVLDLSFEAHLGFHFVSVHKQCKKTSKLCHIYFGSLQVCAANKRSVTPSRAPA